MAASSYKELKEHIGHAIACVGYGANGNIANVAVECEDCCVVLFDFNQDDDKHA